MTRFVASAVAAVLLPSDAVPSNRKPADAAAAAATSTPVALPAPLVPPPTSDVRLPALASPQRREEKRAVVDWDNEGRMPRPIV